jgi:uncharacterized protein YndB with AHSA1/START domain
METTSIDRIEKTVLLRAPRSRVWRAISTTEEFGAWFGAKLNRAFAEGQTVRGQITQPDYQHLTMEILIERIEPEHFFAFRWHPYAVDPNADYSHEPMTLVEFKLEEAGEHTRLTIVESGFDRIPLARRNEAFRMNEGGWSEQVKNIERYVSKS